MPTAPAPLDKLERTIAARAKKPNEKSYTSQLLAGGVEKIGAKISEEAAEVVEAAGEPGIKGREHFIREVGDLIYHLLVLMRHQNCSLSDVETELARRFGVSGLEEKTSRTKPAKKPAAKPAKKAALIPAAYSEAKPTAKPRKKSGL